jgi:short-subunit dehydrogenase
MTPTEANTGDGSARRGRRLLCGMTKCPPSGPRWQRALITGASSGIGEAFARQLASEGTALLLVARRAAHLDTVADECRRAGVAVETLAADLSDHAQVRLVSERLCADVDPVDLLINNAGTTVWGRFDQQPIGRHEELVAVAVTAPMILTHAAAATMASRGSGTIVNVSSTAGNGPVPDLATYSGAKAFINNFTQAVSQELRGSGVTVTTVVPGPTRTRLNNIAERRLDATVREGMEPHIVVRQALAAASGGRRHVITGKRNRLEAFFTPRFPSGLGGLVLRAGWAPMTLLRKRKERRNY